MTAAMLVVALLASPVRADVDPAIVEALAFVRDAPDGGALWSYLNRDPIPIVLTKLPDGVDGRYTRDSQGRGWIELSERLRGAPRKVAGTELYRQYIYRLEDRAPELVDPVDVDTQAGYRVALRYLRDQVQPGGPLPVPPPEIRRHFARWPAHPWPKRGVVISIAISGR